MGTAQVILIIWITITGTMSLACHGKAKGPVSFPVWAVRASILVGLLYWGGFFG